MVKPKLINLLTSRKLAKRYRHIGGRRVLSPLRHPCSPTVCLELGYALELGPLPFFPSSLSPTPYPFRRLLRRLYQNRESNSVGRQLSGWISLTTKIKSQQKITNCTVGVISYTMHCNNILHFSQLPSVIGSLPSLLQEIFLRVLQFSPLLEN